MCYCTTDERDTPAAPMSQTDKDAGYLCVYSSEIPLTSLEREALLLLLTRLRSRKASG
jgi:hypothetical protein